MNEALLIVGMVAATFVSRYPPLVITGRVALPERAVQALSFVPVAVLTAIIAPLILLPEGELDLGLSNAALVAGIITTLVAWRSKNLLLTIIVGMAVFLIWRALVI